jgi:hypothetical protein
VGILVMTSTARASRFPSTSHGASSSRPTRWLAVAALATSAQGVVLAQDAPASAASAPAAASPGAAALRTRYDGLGDKLAHNAFGRPVVLESKQDSDRLQGEIVARVDQPFPMVQKALQGTDNWCSILILHLNVKMCHALPAGLDMALGRKYDQPVDDAYKLHFDYKLEVAAPDYVKAGLSSPDGPLGTRDYRIAVEATPLDATHTILTMSYAYGYGFTARVAMNAYLSTAGADKVGFSVTGKDDDGKPTYVGGVRGLVERNTMRYYLAIDDYVGAPAPSQFDQRLNTWFDATERYPRQLHEIEKADYVAMKKVEAKR